MATLLSLIGNNERFRLKPKNLQGADDVIENGFEGYLEDYGRTAIQDYTNDVNTESPSVSDVGIIALRDSKDYNVFPQDTYVEFDNSPIDVSVIDMPSIEEISEDIYVSNRIYNKYASLDYIPYEVEQALGVQDQLENYAESMEQVLSDLENRGNTLADIFIGKFNTNDSKIGVIGGQALNTALNNQITDGVKRKALGLLNTNVFSLLDGGELIRSDYSITSPKTKLGDFAEFVAKLGGVENPISYIPEEIFNFNRPKSVSNGKVTYKGSELSYTEQMNLLLDYTGKGQEKQLMSLMDMNLYHPKIEGKLKTLYAKEYVGYTHFNKNSLDVREFIVNEDTAAATPYGYYEPYGVISRHKNNERSFGAIEKQIFSDGFWFMWTNDITDLAPTSKIDEAQAIGWVGKLTSDTTLSSNPFKPKTLLFKTQEVVNQGEAFLDLSKKEFTEVIDGESRIISRGDGTTASKTYTDDDGTVIQQGEYFRVWTKQRGYNRLDRTLRHRALDNGDKRSVLNENGLINMAPTTREANGRNNLANDTVIKRYMLSLENLAWNDHMDDLPECEQGAGDPLTGTRGRIMWFPPYNLDFSETVTPNWGGHEFIGRGEKIHTYNNTERTGSLSFTIPVDYPDILQILVGEKTQYWERYFKGDKEIEMDAKKKYKLKKNISQNDLNELDKIKRPKEPRMKKVTTYTKTVKQVEKVKAKEVKKKEEQGEYGKLVLSIYFPNNEITVPRSVNKANLASVSNDEVREALNFAQLKERNVGYEDAGDADGYITNDGYIVRTSNGLEYKDSSGKIVNAAGKTKQATYDLSKLNLYTFPDGCLDIVNETFQDTTNFGLNVPFYFEWQQRFFDILENKTKVQVTFIGNASKPKAAQSKRNIVLANDRAAKSKEWFEKNVKTLLTNLGKNIEYTLTPLGKSDSEDTAAADSGAAENTFCARCDRPYKLPCKKSRRVDIYIKDLSVDDVNPEDADKPEYEKIEEINPVESYVPDDSQDNADPNGDSSPDIDEGLLNKLVYTECDYFKYLETYDPVAFQTISEKIKYFTPAFHSMTPQGFNSRLTFLHQCTRQGESIGMDGVDNIKNLAFGRPPVCILRIGDFFHVKVIITGLSIDYKGAGAIPWDLNPEGIGIQPMMANVTLNITILGGMSMTAPINRLQNALSFNFYANTEMYDSRADSVVFNENYGSDANLDKEGKGLQRAARIVDGIKLSSIFKYTDAQKAEQLKKIQQESRLYLSNSTDALVPTDQIETLGTDLSISELKKRAGLPMTEKEKIDKMVEDNVDKLKFILGNLNSNDVKNIQKTIAENLKNENSLLNQQVKDILTRKAEVNAGKGNFEDYKKRLQDFSESIKQYMQASSSNPSQITEENVLKTENLYYVSFVELYPKP